MNIPIGQASNIDYVFIQDSSSTTGAGLTGITSGSSGLAGRYIYPGGTSVALTFETISTLGTYQAPTSNAHLRIKELDATNHPGVYEIHYHNDWFSTANARKAAILTIKGVTNMAQLNHKVTIDYALQPATAARTLTVSSTGAALANLGEILGTALTETAGQIAAGFKKVFDVAAPVFTAASVNQTGDNYARLGAPAGASVSADVAAVKSDSATLLARIGSFTGTGVNTILGMFKALLNKAASTPSDVGGTFDASTDSTEAIRDNMGTAQTGDSYARLGAPAGASIAADIAATPAAVWAVVVHTGITALQAMRMFGAMLAGKTSGAGTGTVTFRNPIDTLDAMIITMTGSNRTATTKDLSA